jgi:hypothetical protein
MLPSPRIFRSRWFALLWAAGIIWMAVDVAGSASGDGATPAHAGVTDAVGQPVNAADLAALANALP